MGTTPRRRRPGWSGSGGLAAAARAAGAPWLETCLTGGDDYELLMAVPRDGGAALAARASQLGIAVTRIGRFVPDSGQSVRVLDGAGRVMTLKRAGLTHF